MAEVDPLLGYVHSLETAGAVDGPGIRVVVFLSGCPLRCLYCHNPDTRAKSSGTPWTLEALLAEILKYKDFMRASGGGVTLSGGEPLFQQAFAAKLLKRCKAAGLHTALDTSGYLGERTSDALLASTDLVLLCFKSFDPLMHKTITGIGIDEPLAFARKLARLKKPVWARFVLVPKLTDDLVMIGKLAVFLKELGNIERVELLPFHKMGEPKWRELGLPYALAATQPPAPESVAAAQAAFRAEGLKVF
jgi:pyruvate formate lyase activating enzyme